MNDTMPFIVIATIAVLAILFVFKKLLDRWVEKIIVERGVEDKRFVLRGAYTHDKAGFTVEIPDGWEGRELSDGVKLRREGHRKWPSAEIRFSGRRSTALSLHAMESWALEESPLSPDDTLLKNGNAEIPDVTAHELVYQRLRSRTVFSKVQIYCQKNHWVYLVRFKFSGMTQYAELKGGKDRCLRSLTFFTPVASAGILTETTDVCFNYLQMLRKKLTTRESLFVSYRSTDANEVRPIVDILRAHGLRVWFAEYEVLTKNYKAFDEELDTQIRLAIDRCDHAIICSNKSWDSSKHCKSELMYIQEKFGSYDLHKKEVITNKATSIAGSASVGDSRNGVLHVQMPRQKLRDDAEHALKGLPTYEHQEGGYAETAKFVMAQLAPEVDYCPPPVLISAKQSVLSKSGYSVKMNFGQYDYNSYDATALYYGRKPTDILMYQFKGRFESIDLSLLVTLIPPRRSAARIYPDVGGSNRKHYGFLRGQADSWHKNEQHAEEGLHLFMHGGFPRLGMTFLKRNRRGSFGLHRTYILHIAEQGAEKMAEVQLSFAMPCKNSSDDALGRFLRITPCLDEIARSVTYVYKG